MIEFRRTWCHLCLLVLGFGCALASAGQWSAGHDHDQMGEVRTAASRIRHVFIIVLENKNYSDTFGTSTQDPYLQKTLVPMGALFEEYYGTGHVSLDNYISLLSGQAPTPDTTDDCIPGLISTTGLGNFNDVEQTGTTPDGQVIAQHGCVYPKHVKTLANQLEERGYTWRAYMEDMGNDPARENATCGHPKLGVGTDNTNSAEAPSAAVPKGDAYATRHNPFVYFHSIIDKPSCHTNVVNLEHLASDLQRGRTTPNLVFITPNLCHDGHDGAGTGAAGTLCASGEPGGLTSADAFLQTWVPRIMASQAYKDDGMIFITFDESSYGAESATSPTTGQTEIDITFNGQTCCNQKPGPNLAGVRPGSITLVNTPALIEKLIDKGYGGDRIGAVALSPFIKAGSVTDVPYNHYSLLRSLEDIFRLDGHLGYAAENPGTGYLLDTIGDNREIFHSDVHFGHWIDPQNQPHF
jgi:hypothetical protein